MSRIVVKIFSFLISLWVILTIAFFIIRIAPGGPFSGEKKLPKEVEENLIKIYGLDKDILTQYLITMRSFILFDFGVTYTSNGQRKVMENVKESIGVSMELGLYAFLIAIFLGIFTGFISGSTKSKFIEITINISTTAGLSLPAIVFAPILLLIFSFYFPLFSAGGWESWRDKVLPSITLGFLYAVPISRLAKAGVVDAMQMPHIINVRAIGEGNWGIFRHTIKFALLPVFGYLGPAIASLLTGSIVVERIFLVPGISHYFVESALSRDYPMVMGVVLVYSIFLLFFNFIIDLIYPIIDPRIKEKIIK